MQKAFGGVVHTQIPIKILFDKELSANHPNNLGPPILTGHRTLDSTPDRTHHT